MGVSDKPSSRLRCLEMGGITTISSMLVLMMAHTFNSVSASSSSLDPYATRTHETLLPVAAAAVSQSLAAGTEPSWLLGWQQLQQQRMDRLDSVLKVAVSTAAAKQPSGLLWSLITLIIPNRFANRDQTTLDHYIKQQRPMFAARDLDQFTKVLYPSDHELDLIMIQHGMYDINKPHQSDLQAKREIKRDYQHTVFGKASSRHSRAFAGRFRTTVNPTSTSSSSRKMTVSQTAADKGVAAAAEGVRAAPGGAAARGRTASVDDATATSDLDELLARVEQAAHMPTQAKLRRLMTTTPAPAPAQGFVTPEMQSMLGDMTSGSGSSGTAGSSAVATPRITATDDAAAAVDVPQQTTGQVSQPASTVSQPSGKASGSWAPATAAAAVAAAARNQQQNAWAYRIVGGQEAPLNRYKWACSLRAANDFHYCGCSLIAPSVVLTAAHCLDHSTNDALSKPYVEIGRHFLNGSNRTEGNDYDRIKCERSVVHKGWSFTTGLNDIALCFLEKESRFDPIKIAEATNSLADGKELTVMGWGANSEGARNAPQLMEVKVDVVDTATCNRTYQNAIRSTQICAGVPAGGADACQGDSGGPLIVAGENSEDDLQVGIVSFGVGCGRPNTPGVYTDISKYRDFIKQHLLANSVSYKPLTGSAKPSAGAEDASPATEAKPDSSSSSSSSSSSNDPCSCTIDGVSGGLQVGLVGCKQHGLDQGDVSHYCYTKGGRKCESATASTAYPGAAWHACKSDDDESASADSPEVAASSGASDTGSNSSSEQPSVVGGVVAGALEAIQGWMFNNAATGAPLAQGSQNKTAAVRAASSVP